MSEKEQVWFSYERRPSGSTFVLMANLTLEQPWRLNFFGKTIVERKWKQIKTLKISTRWIRINLLFTLVWDENNNQIDKTKSKISWGLSLQGQLSIRMISLWRGLESESVANDQRRISTVGDLVEKQKSFDENVRSSRGSIFRKSFFNSIVLFFVFLNQGKIRSGSLFAYRKNRHGWSIPILRVTMISF